MLDSLIARTGNMIASLRGRDLTPRTSLVWDLLYDLDYLFVCKFPCTTVQHMYDGPTVVEEVETQDQHDRIRAAVVMKNNPMSEKELEKTTFVWFYKLSIDGVDEAQVMSRAEKMHQLPSDNEVKECWEKYPATCAVTELEYKVAKLMYDVQALLLRSEGCQLPKGYEFYKLNRGGGWKTWVDIARNDVSDCGTEKLESGNDHPDAFDKRELCCLDG